MPVEDETDEQIRETQAAIYQEVYAQRVEQAKDRWLTRYIYGGGEPQFDDFATHYEQSLIHWRRSAEEAAKKAAMRGTRLSWHKIRELVWQRDQGICQVCGVRLHKDLYDCGHIIDRIVGGSDRPANLVAMCVLCNQGKPITKTRGEYLEWAKAGGPIWEVMDELAQYPGFSDLLQSADSKISYFPRGYIALLERHFVTEDDGRMYRNTA
ncbi:MAG: HNH endonuclease [Caldilineaceae bacterium]